MKIKFHGSRGSFPISIHSQRVLEVARSVFELSQKRNLKTWDQVLGALSDQKHSLKGVFGGATTCAEVFTESAGVPIFIDAGTGLTMAGLDPNSQLNDASFKQGQGRALFLMTHTHWDHIIGLPTIEQLYRVGNLFSFYGVHKKLEDRLSILFSESHFPVPYSVVKKNMEYHQIPLGERVHVGGVTIDHTAQSHPGGSFAYRIEEKDRSLVFATDIELKKTMVLGQSEQLYSDADVLVMDAQYTPEELVLREGYGHSDIYVTVEFGVKHRAKTLVLFHQSPSYDDRAIDLQLKRAIDYHEEMHPHSRMKIIMAIEGSSLEI